ncbi:hypothetical protein EN829_014215 [Mesorhizobium sp. M00.F.Ca.ET.186.01.1.1]|nr:hypothetical protein EN848_15210 [bacterium M00.F.Ca.ET.205.01.1.1]TGU52846.1 hypothetical protein EN795_14185 [bacterium M00.F.Ca.ET.152.01.1.1]TGV35816.1 hypothetical protein EN829_014215 [Mesorhizobium sp. M00.F.Ca.ET.186.01.1.1]TGZ43398.1 hypothetical protein EN805_09795 [bacterium M00.F.Ca.ET.162.01.1.1]
MAIQRPFRRTVRQFSDGSYANGGCSRYILHPKYSVDSAHYVRALNVIQKDVVYLFDYIEPSDANLSCYSFRTHELLMRICIEVEANLKAILLENGYTKAGNLNMADYKKVEGSHFLSCYAIQIPIWREGPRTIYPFENWMDVGKPVWYQDYNAAKHDRHAAFPKANFENLLQAVAGLVVLISSQFRDEDFSRRSSSITIEEISDEFEDAVGGLFRIRYPNNIATDLRYDFSWDSLMDDADPFDGYKY